MLLKCLHELRNMAVMIATLPQYPCLVERKLSLMPAGCATALQRYAMYASLNALGARMSNQRLHSHPQLAPIPALLPAPAVNSKARSLLLLLLSASLAAAQQQQSQAGQQQQAALQLPLLLLVTALPLHSRHGV